MAATRAEEGAVLVARAAVARGPFLAGKAAVMAAVVKVASAKDGSTCKGTLDPTSSQSCLR